MINKKDLELILSEFKDFQDTTGIKKPMYPAAVLYTYAHPKEQALSEIRDYL